MDANEDPLKAYSRAFVRYVFAVDDVTFRIGITVCREPEGEYIPMCCGQ